MDTFLKDIRHSVRMFLENPGFTITAVAALTLGIGANTAIFSVVNAVLLKPVPFAEPDRLVMLMNTSPQGSGPGASPAKFRHWQAQSDVLVDVAAFRSGVMNYTGGDIAEQFQSAQVSLDYFRTFRTPIFRGRAFSAEEDLPGGPKVALLSYNTWARRYASDPSVVGTSISLDGQPYTITGIVGPDFDVREFGPAPDVWVPFQIAANTTDQGHYFTSAGRLKPGVTLAQARARLQASAADFRAKYPNALPPNAGFDVTPFREAFVRNVRSSLLVLLGAVSLVLLIACANVANLLLMRATGRKREIAIRAAIGAGRGRIIRQLLTESVLLATVGGAFGLVLGFVGMRALMSVSTAGLPRVGPDGAAIGLDWRVVGFTLGVSLLTGVVFGLIPALQGSRTDLNAVIKDSAGRSGSGFRQNKARSMLVVAELGLAVVLLVGSALLIRSFVALGSVNPGFNVDNVLTMQTSLTGTRYETAAGVEQVVRDGMERIRSLPGVAAASATCCVPLQGGYGLPFIVLGRPLEGPSTGGAGWITTSPGYFDVFQIPIKRGRPYNERDDRNAPGVVLINEAMVRQFWKEGDPLNDRLVIGRGFMREFKEDPDRQIIGIVGDVRDGGLNNEPQPRMYVPQAQVPDAANALNVRLSPMAWVVRTQGNPLGLSRQIQEQIRQATALPVASVTSMGEIVSQSTSRERLNMLLMTVFASCALLLAGIGVYGLMASAVEQRTMEIGIRLALGADVARVKHMVVLQGMSVALIGVAIGIGSAFGLTRFLASFLFEVKTHDLMVFVLVPLVLSLVALAAVWIPASRASRVDPIQALRYD